MKRRGSSAAGAAVVLAALLSALAACGGGGGGAGCPEPFAACGGDVQGSWELVAGCYAIDNPLADDCPESTLTTAPRTSGTIVFRSDGTYSSSLTLGALIRLELPASCLEDQTCTDLSDPADDRACSGTDQCTCTTDVADSTSEDEGTYSTAGTSATLTPTLELPRSVDYCVDGDNMAVRLPGTDPEIVLVFTR